MRIAFKELGISHEVGSYIWCLHCEQVFLAETVKHKKETRGIFKGEIFYSCPNEGCNGSALDFYSWCGDEIPILGKKYPDWPFIVSQEEASKT